MFLANALLTFSALTGLLLGVVMLVSNPKKAVNQSLAAFLFAIFIWLLANLLSNLAVSEDLSLWFARATLVGASLIPYCFILFAKSYTAESKTHLKQVLLLGVPSFLIILTTPTRLNIVSIKAYGNDTVTGPIYIALILVAVIYFLWGFSILFGYSRRTRNNVERTQLRYIFTGIILSLTPVVIANGILPTLGITNAIVYGPSTIILLAIFMSVAIIRHRLLDIRLVVARSIGYLASLLVLAAVYGVLVFGAASVLFHLHFSAGLQVFIAGATAVAALSFGSLKSFFARNTNKLFYRDAYDTQVFLDEFNKTLVATYELDQLLKKSIEIIDKNIRPLNSLFIVNQTSNTKSRLVGAGNKDRLTKQDISTIQGAVANTKQKLIVTDELDSSHSSLQNLLRGKDIVLVAKLASDNAGAKADVGYLMLGPKKSGNLYSSQDIQVIEIVSNELVIAVQNSLRFEEIQNFNLTLQGRIDEATKKLRKANEKLREMDETKDDFISMASHQLRTPLTSVKGYISMVLEEDAGKITHMQREMLGQAFFSSQRMVYLIADLLNVSRLKTGKFIIEPTPVDLAEVVEQELSQLEETAAAHSLTLQYDKPKHFPTLMFDETKTRQVIMNFVDNAIYYTPNGGHITVQLTNNKSTIELRILDNGIGVPKREQPHLFTKFYRADNARKARPDGTGLGLFMAKKVIVAQGGSIVFDSQEGKGSTFGFIFSKHKLGAKPTTTDKPTEKTSETAAAKR
jgi:signal transduction histidine kinase